MMARFPMWSFYVIMIAFVGFCGFIVYSATTMTPRVDHTAGLPVVRSCTSGMYVWARPDGSYIAGYPNPMYERYDLPANTSPEEFCL